MEFLTNMFGSPNSPAVNLVLLTLGLVLLLLIVFWFFRRFIGSPAIKSVRGRQPRLAVTDAANLDDRRRLVLVRRDDVEHLVMIGGATDVLIESNIVRTQTAPAPKPAPVIPATPAAAVAPTTSIIPIAPAATVAPIAPAATVNLAKEINLAPQPIPKAPVVAAAVGGLAAVATSVTSEAKAAVTSVKKADPIAPIKDVIKTDEPIKNTVDNIKEKAVEASVPKVDTIDLSGMEDALSEELVQNTTQDAPKVKAEVKPELTKIAATKTAPTTPKATDDKVEMEDEMQKLLDELAGDKT